MHGDTLSNTQHIIMKYGLNTEPTDPIWSKKVPQSNLGLLPIQVFLFPNEQYLLIVYHSNQTPSTAVLAVLNASDGT